MTGKIKNVLVALMLLFAALVLSVNMMEGAEDDFQNDSEVLVLGPIAADLLDVEIDTESYGLGWLRAGNYPDEDVYFIMGDDSCDEFRFEVYKSQVGIQGMLFRAGLPLYPSFGILYLYRGLCCFLLTVVLMLIVWQLYKKFGLLFAAVFGFVTMTSPWIVNFSRNLYWVEFTWFIPMLLGLLCLNYKSKRKYIYPLFFAAIFLKCLCGYEYLSTIMMASIMFLAAEWICCREERKEIFKCIFSIGICSVAGFLAAYVMHASIYGSGNIADGLKMVLADIVAKRTFGSGGNFDPVIEYSLSTSVLDVLVRYFWTKGSPFDGKLMLLIAVTATLALAFRKMVLKKEIKRDVCLFVLSLLTTVSWLVLAKGHSYIHPHISFVLFYFGWVQISIYIVIRAFLDLAGDKTKCLGAGK